MTDKQWNKVIVKCKTACDKHKYLLKIAEDEYERRYGNNPSEVDDETWIDYLHYGRGFIDLKSIIENAKWSNDK